jgi:hypothetical protein
MDAYLRNRPYKRWFVLLCLKRSECTKKKFMQERIHDKGHEGRTKEETPLQREEATNNRNNC